MRGFRSFLILTGVAIALGAYIYFVELDREPGGTPEKKDKVFAFEPGKIEELEIHAASGEVTFVVPAGITSLAVEAWGGGGGGSLGGVGGGGGYATATFSVTPLTSFVIGVARGGVASAGGGMSYVRFGASDTSGYVVVAGGGGGAGIDGDSGNLTNGNGNGGAGGAAVGEKGIDASYPNYGNGNAGAGGTQSAGGTGGTVIDGMAGGSIPTAGAVGAIAAGGVGGGSAPAAAAAKTWKGGTSAAGNGAGGSGGAGYYGGGGGGGKYTYWGAGGGGGSSFITPLGVGMTTGGAGPLAGGAPPSANVGKGGAKGNTAGGGPGFVRITF